jgi:2',3'-cyclic-nucleotide 2'-phosphodiesterase (5'-nucleotidase family)
LFVDAGNLFSDERFVAGQLPAWVQTKNRWIVKAGSEFQLDAANVSHYDLPYMSQLLAKDGYDKRVSEFPFLKKLVSANTVPLNSDLEPPPAYVVREITLKRPGPERVVRFGIVGLTELKPIGASDRIQDYAGFRIEDPFLAAKRVIPELRKRVDFVVVLAYMTQDQAQRLATENPDIDAVIGGRQVGDRGELQQFNRTAIVYADNQTKHLGELRFYLNEDGSVKTRNNRFVPLDDFIPDDASAAQVVSAAHTEFTSEQSQDITQSTPATNGGFIPSVDSPFAGVDTCVTCHSREYAIWKKTGHSHAMATLESRSQQFDTDCVRCHVVGYEMGGFQTLNMTPHLANVQCEACHGPGRDHAQSPAKGYGALSTPAGCMQCHTKTNSPEFNFETYWPRVKH